MNLKQRLSLLTPYLAPYVALLAYGGWAAFSNMAFGMKPMLLAFLVQGSFAFVSTWLLTKLVIALLKQQSGRRMPVFLLCSFLLAAIPASLHALAGTPNIFQAMLPGLILGNGYLWLLLQRLGGAAQLRDD